LLNTNILERKKPRAAEIPSASATEDRESNDQWLGYNTIVALVHFNQSNAIEHAWV